MPRPSIIVIEGPDATGKSTLARQLSSLLGWEVLHSGGPERYPGEINERTARLSQLKNVIFDRHPCISHPIYNSLRPVMQTDVSPSLIDQFYDSDPLLIYAREKVGKELLKEHDTPDHRRLVELKAKEIAHLYDLWAVRRCVHFVYQPRQPNWAVNLVEMAFPINEDLSHD